MRIRLTDIIELVGDVIPGDKDEYLACDQGHRFPEKPWETDQRVCPTCQHTLLVHLPRGERWGLRWQLFIHKYLPHRVYVPKQKGVPKGVKRWEWRNHVLSERPYKSSFVLDDDEQQEEGEE